MKPLDRTISALDAHWGHLQESLRKISIPHAATLAIDTSITSEFARASLFGSSCEFVTRERGGKIPVNLLTQNEEASFWFSWFEEWTYISAKRWRYRQSGITVFEGPPASQTKNQLFRIEWPGFTDWHPPGLNWQAPGAGHPHWQFDALSELKLRFERETQANELQKKLLEEPELQEFDAAALASTTSKKHSSSNWTQMHFANQARWTELGWDGDVKNVKAHAHAPEDDKEIRRWVIASILYIHAQISRHALHVPA